MEQQGKTVHEHFESAQSNLNKEELEKHELLAKSEISLWLDSYDYIFSDFDPRPYNQRALSDDFLLEVNKASREIKPGVFELRFLIPTNSKSHEHEALIKKRLRDHFKKHAVSLELEIKKEKNKGILLAAAGFAMLLLVTYLSLFADHLVAFKFLRVILEPAGWFSCWFGLDIIFYASRDKKESFEFYSRMTRAEILFSSY